MQDISSPAKQIFSNSLAPNSVWKQNTTLASQAAEVSTTIGSYLVSIGPEPDKTQNASEQPNSKLTKSDLQNVIGKLQSHDS